MVQSIPMASEISVQTGLPGREFTVATFVIANRRVLLLWHRKLQKWLPPGGHVEPGELPDEAAVREVREETGLEVELVGDRGLEVSSPRQLVRPYGIQLEDIGPGHQHIDLIYFARPKAGTSSRVSANEESEAVRWFALAELGALGVADEIRLWTERAIQALNNAS